ncbi:hypothetical protein [Pandoraea apista]|uniref:hypothetical protein n=1 Tax=Pandoraea apista TaxID=93218 RepID=UPI000657913D|nr:hypothetical protein [Pandoraea apista]ALS65188.1 hypothetical protein AT395_09460 [Pandoraea apista]RRW90336.1 hypothetical protein EGJ54_22685 [Pandoraea apista]RRX00097.1 hypothetical protein EGJ56_20820 [Pandoraea apista]CFB65618.1 hypothetical protein LMG16407_04970 [Pandoraea apista]
MNVLMKKNETVVPVKVGVAWSFWFGLAFPIVAIVAYVRRRLYIPALIVIGYIAIQTFLRTGGSTWMGLIDVIPDESAYPSKDFYMVSLLLWCAYGLYVGRYALWGNKITAQTLARRGYVCPVPEHAELAGAAWSIEDGANAGMGHKQPQTQGSSDPR